jgi:hypothetical protein
MTRDQAINLVSMYDNAYPHDLIDMYLQYYKMTRAEFDLVLDKHVNINLFKKVNGIWQPLFKVAEHFEIKNEDEIIT